MKIFLAILAVVIALLGLLWLSIDKPPPGQTQSRTDLPWQLSPQEDGSLRVFDLHLGKSVLIDAIEKFGPYESMALFRRASGDYDLEVYFGTVSMGPLKAKIVTTLDVPAEEKKLLADSAIDREGSPTGDWKLKLSNDAMQAQQQRLLYSISYIPTYGGLEADFFRERFGEPDAWKKSGEKTVQWFYPDRGLSILINADDKEVLEYLPPRLFQMPEDVVYAE